MAHARKAFTLAALLCTMAACHGRPRTWSKPEAGQSTALARGQASSKGEGDIVEIDLSRGAPETASGGLFATTPRPTYYRLVTLLKQLANESTTHGVLVRLGSARFGWSRAQELANLFAKVRETHKIICHADGYGNSSLWLAARGCDRIWVSPAGGVETIGVAIEAVYANRLLADKLGIDVDFLQIGKFKGAEEPFTRNGPSPEARASLENVLSAISNEWLSGLAQGRGQKMREAAEDGPFAAEEAKRRGLVDEVGYLDEARDDAKKLTGGEGFDLRFGVAAHASDRPDIAELLRAVAGGGAARGGSPHIVLVRAVGAISMESGGSILGGRAGITEKALGRTIRELTDDASVNAVVLRIDSPGGSALASDLLWRALMQLRAKKPLVVSVGDMAASGGYYLASTANRILAEPTSIVGSIGVVGGKLAFGPALENIGVHAEPIAPPGSPAGKRISYESALQPWDPETRERVRSEMTAVYDLFVRRVAEGRGLSVETIAPAAEGRIFAGPLAKDMHLIDEWGGLDQAIAAARSIGHLDDNVPVRVAGETNGLLDWFGDDDSASDEARASSWVSLLTRAAGGSGRSDPDNVPRGVLDCMATLAPLVRGERTLTALPFALLLR